MRSSVWNAFLPTAQRVPVRTYFNDIRSAGAVNSLDDPSAQRCGHHRTSVPGVLIRRKWSRASFAAAWLLTTGRRPCTTHPGFNQHED